MEKKIVTRYTVADGKVYAQEIVIAGTAEDVKGWTNQEGRLVAAEPFVRYPQHKEDCYNMTDNVEAIVDTYEDVYRYGGMFAGCNITTTEVVFTLEGTAKDTWEKAKEIYGDILEERKRQIEHIFQDVCRCYLDEQDRKNLFITQNPFSPVRRYWRKTREKGDLVDEVLEYADISKEILRKEEQEKEVLRAEDSGNVEG